jgi:chlorobactene glucosyltransferase
VELFISSLWFAVTTWLIARAAAQRGLLPHLAPAASPPPAQAPRVAVIVPARDEEANLGPCLQALAAQDYAAERLSILVIDDHSGDATAAIAEAFAARDPRFTLLRAPPLPPYWTGKSHACAIGARAVGPDVAWLCFIDADVRVEPGCISSAMRAALEERLDLLSVAPRQQLRSFAERLIIPCGLVLISFIKDLRQAQARDGKDVTATGQFMLMRRDGYDAVGGHAAVREAICEDLELARRVKRSGRAVLLMGGEGLLSTRMYSGWRTLWPGFAKNLVDMLGGPAATVAVALAAVVLAWAAVAVPVVDAASWVQSWSQSWGPGTNVAGPDLAQLLALVLAVTASAAAFALHVAATFYFRIPFWYGLLFPLGYTLGALIALDSVRRRWRGRVSWKGRIYS